MDTKFDFVLYFFYGVVEEDSTRGPTTRTPSVGGMY